MFGASFWRRSQSPKHTPAKKVQKSPETQGFGDFSWQGQKESNPRHAVLETAALPAELYPYILVGLHGLEPWTDRL